MVGIPFYPIAEVTSLFSHSIFLSSLLRSTLFAISFMIAAVKTDPAMYIATVINWSGCILSVRRCIDSVLTVISPEN